MRFLILLCLTLLAGAAFAGDKQAGSQRELDQAWEAVEKARERLREAQSDYTDAMAELKGMQLPNVRYFGTDLLRNPSDDSRWNQAQDDVDDVFSTLPFAMELRDGNARFFMGGPGYPSSNAFFHNLHQHAHSMQLVSLNPALGQYFGSEEGVLVVNVSGNNRYHLQPGDVILSIDGRESIEPDRVHQLLRTYSDSETVTMTVMRNKEQRNLVSGQR